MTPPRRWVVDASAAVEFLLRTERGARVAEGFRASNFAPINAPHLMVTEAISTLRGLCRTRHLDVPGAELALGELAELPCTFWDPQPLTNRVWSMRDNMSAYDATYVALAEALDASLVTCDRRLASAAAAVSHVVVKVA
ncbi:twitching motility protein PilT [Knoellia sinensis KCTC 19936]|uniref:Ribonuclease VapC n=1 Tax=Knoellia sinensis KCTC 19936 TaxID=1385520 RepID=A0A0A0JA68_9MICO|nr:type II toxin-antitoxin system VapC family toxin [Knoellia sinensis]KGN33694.1 twitching motility protein PilT [Knoellia sinensis KCTC 19936]